MTPHVQQPYRQIFYPIDQQPASFNEQSAIRFATFDDMIVVFFRQRVAGFQVVGDLFKVVLSKAASLEELLEVLFEA